MESCCHGSPGTWPEPGECPREGLHVRSPLSQLSGHLGGREAVVDPRHGPQSQNEMEAPSLELVLAHYSTAAGLDLPHL